MDVNSKERLTQMIEKYQHLIFSVCVKMTQDYFVAEDLTQDTFLAAFCHLDRFDGVNEKAWLCRIASNKCIDYMKQAERRSVPSTEETLDMQPAGDGQPEKYILEKDAYHELKNRCGSLSPPYDRIAAMYFMEGKKAAEIAGLTGKNIKTVQTQIYRARAMLREKIQNENF
ncbi:MAG: sigma-70 family RNA polymerase sigma factor [Lachnospiraceae bacterium]|nr:sigma-70 family RNA polymerase sigma factor [Lachnospiraceae bacterium]